MNLYKSFDFFKEDLKREFPSLKVFLEFPKPYQKAQYPYLSIFVVDINREPFLGNNFLKSMQSGNKITNYYSTSDLTISLNLQFFSESGKIKPVFDFIDMFTQYMQKDLKKNGSRCLTLKYGSMDFELATFSLINSVIDQTNSENIALGFYRVLFNVMVDMSEIITTDEYLAKSIELVNSEVSENATTVSNK